MSKTKRRQNGRRNTRPTIAYLTPEAVVDPTPQSNQVQADIIYELIAPESFARPVAWASGLHSPTFQNESLSDKAPSALQTHTDPRGCVFKCDSCYRKESCRERSRTQSI